MSELNEYKCPNCGGAITFDSSIQKMKCPYCDAEFEMEALKELDRELQREASVKDQMHWDQPEGSEWQKGEKEGIFLYSCDSCGGEIMASATTGATSCPYCGNPVVMKEQFAGMLRPDFVIPFKLDKEAAKKGLMKHFEGKKLLPKVFKDQNHLDEVKGVYVPFWLYDTDANANIRYKATRVRTWSDTNYIYTQTSFYQILREGSIGFESVPVDGSQRMPNDLMESIEPFNYAEGVDFQTAYLAGYFADKYDVSMEDCMTRANERIKNSTIEAFRSTVQGYATVTTENASVRYKGNRTRYALLPVWILNTTWNGQKYLFAMNGQTGKFVGNLPCDKGLLTKYFLTAGLIAAAIAATVLTVIWFLA